MRYFKRTFLVISVLLCTCMANDAYANKAAVTIEAPDSAAPGTEITIRVTVTHSANNMFHHVQWVYIMINGAEVARWDYSWSKLPDNPPFIKEIKYTVKGPAEIKAEASCNIHGSAGPAYKKITIK
jgi:desulfoferrodoxin (superoxide reductase-like protein)